MHWFSTLFCFADTKLSHMSILAMHTHIQTYRYIVHLFIKSIFILNLVSIFRNCFFLYYSNILYLNIFNFILCWNKLISKIFILKYSVFIRQKWNYSMVPYLLALYLWNKKNKAKDISVNKLTDTDRKPDHSETFLKLQHYEKIVRINVHFCYIIFFMMCM